MDLVFVLAHVAGVLIPDRYSDLPTAYSQVKLLYLSLFPSGPPIADVVPVNPPCTHIVGSSQVFGSSRMYLSLGSIICAFVFVAGGHG